MVLPGDVVQVFDLLNGDQCCASGIDLIHGRFVGAALVHGDLLGNTVGLHSFVKEPQGCRLVAPGGQQEVNRFSLLVYRAVEILPVAFDLDIGLVHAPAATHRMLVLAEHLLKQ